jgi:hypothetical protein
MAGAHTRTEFVAERREGDRRNDHRFDFASFFLFFIFFFLLEKNTRALQQVNVILILLLLYSLIKSYYCYTVQLR